MDRRSLLRATLLGTAASVVAGAALPGTAANAAPVGRVGRYGTGPSRWGPAVQPVNIAARLKTLPPETTQVIVVYGPDYITTSATLQTYQKVNGVWQFVNVALPARIGSEGFSDDHREGVSTTPTGVYSIGPTMYGISPNPGVRYSYHQLVTNDWWNENSASPYYNTFQHVSTNPGGYSEALWQITPAYTHFAVITFNMSPNVPKPIPDAGSGIFLHQHSTNAGPTAGCVSLAHDHLVSVLTWLDPAASPRIVLSPYANLSRY